MTVRLGINGFGRIGRLVVRALRDHPSLQVAHVNDPNADAAASAHLLEFDSVHGRFDTDISTVDDRMIVDGTTITHSAHGSPTDVGWADRGVDIVIETSGRFRTVDVLEPYLDGGVQKVIVAAHHHPRRHQHLGHRRRAPHRASPSPVCSQLARTDIDRLGDGHLPDLPGAGRQARRHRRTGAGYERIADRCRLRGR